MTVDGVLFFQGGKLVLHCCVTAWVRGAAYRAPSLAPAVSVHTVTDQIPIASWIWIFSYLTLSNPLSSFGLETKRHRDSSFIYGAKLMHQALLYTNLKRYSASHKDPFQSSSKLQQLFTTYPITNSQSQRSDPSNVSSFLVTRIQFS